MTRESQILTRAVDIIHERGWSPHGAYGPDGSVCTAVAVNIASASGVPLTIADRAANTRCHAAVLLTIHELYPFARCRTIANWNDHTATHPDQVTEVLKLAAERCEDG